MQKFLVLKHWLQLVPFVHFTSECLEHLTVGEKWVLYFNSIMTDCDWCTMKLIVLQIRATTRAMTHKLQPQNKEQSISNLPFCVYLNQRRRNAIIEHVIQHVLLITFLTKSTCQNQTWNIELEVQDSLLVFSSLPCFCTFNKYIHTCNSFYRNFLSVYSF